MRLQDLLGSVTWSLAFVPQFLAGCQQKVSQSLARHGPLYRDIHNLHLGVHLSAQVNQGTATQEGAECLLYGIHQKPVLGSSPSSRGGHYRGQTPGGKTTASPQRTPSTATQLVNDQGNGK